jgi:hypothetical protein
MTTALIIAFLVVAGVLATIVMDYVFENFERAINSYADYLEEQNNADSE